MADLLESLDNFLEEYEDNVEEGIWEFLASVFTRYTRIPEECRDEIYDVILKRFNPPTYELMSMLGLDFAEYLRRGNYTALYKHFIKHPEQLSEHAIIKDFCKFFGYEPAACDTIFHLRTSLENLNFDDDEEASEEEENDEASEEDEEY